MPYIIKKAKDKEGSGYKVCKRDEPTRCFSKHPLSEDTAKRQRTAIIMSEMGMSKKKGGSGSDEPLPKTISAIKEYLISRGFENEVFDLNERVPKPKKKDWEELLQKMKDVKPRTLNITGTLVRDATEAFQQLGITPGRRS